MSLSPQSLLLLSTNVTTVFVCLIVICLIIIKKQLEKSHNYQVDTKFKPIPSPPALLWFGHMHLLKDHKDNPWAGFELIREKYGNIVGLKMGVHHMVLVSDFELAKEVLLKKGEIFADRPKFPRYKIIFGGDQENSLALCNWSQVHKDRRKMCKRAIVPSNYSSRHQLLESLIDKSIETLFNEIVKKECSTIDVSTSQLASVAQAGYTLTKENILFLTSDVFMEFLCSQNYPHTDEDYKKFNHGCDFVFWDINQSLIIDFLPLITPLFEMLTGYLKDLERLTDQLRHFIHKRIFVPRLDKHTKAVEDNETCENPDYLDQLIREYLSKTTSLSLADYRVGFEDLLAGHAAVSNILMRVLGHLALNENIQTLIHQEVQHVDLEDIEYRTYIPITEASLLEALRLASSPIVPHVAREDTPLGDHLITQGTMILFNMYHVNLDETRWDKPCEYNPMRFVESTNNTTRPLNRLNVPKHFIPFSQGPRQCLGFKMVERITIKTVANICKKYVIKASDENMKLAEKLLTPKGSVALELGAKCYSLRLYPR